MEPNPPVSFEDTSIAFSAKSNKALKRMRLLFGLMNYPFLVNLATNLLKATLYLRIPIKSLVKKTIFQHFCGGETIEECRSKSLELNSYGIGTILDHSVEGSEDEEDFDLTTTEILNTIEKSGIEPKNPFCVFKASGIASNFLLGKVQNGSVLADGEQKAWENVQDRFNRICEKACQEQVKVLIDAEESWIQAPVDLLAYEMMSRYNRRQAIVFNTFQMYRKDMYHNLKDAFHKAVSENYYLGVKLVRGAYMEKERERARERGYKDPIQPNKEATDEDFNKALEYCIDNRQRISLCCGSHNEYSNYYLTVLMEKYHIQRNDPAIYFAQLYGMSDNISFNLAHAGFNVVKYLPYGPVNDVVPYLIRRAEENTAITGQSSREYLLIKKEIYRRKSQARRS